MADVQVRLVRSVRLLPYHCQEVTVKLERETLEAPLLVECTAALQCAVHALVSPTAEGVVLTKHLRLYQNCRQWLCHR